MTTCEVSLSSADHLAGDLVRATVSFRSDNGDILDWAAVQVHGHSWHDAKLVSPALGGKRPLLPAAPTSAPSPVAPALPSLATNPTPHKAKQTAMPDMSSWVEGSSCLFATRPHCLCAELALPTNGSAVTYFIESKLPPVLPPSFRGTSARYGYLVTICVKVRSEQFARVAHVPFFVAGTGNSLGDAARLGAPSALFLERTTSSLNANGKRQALATSLDQVNVFPMTYEAWTGEVRSSTEDGRERLVWRMELGNSNAEEERDALPLPQPSPNLQGGGRGGGGDVDQVRAFHASTSRGRIARCVQSPLCLHPGDACNLQIFFLQPGVERVTRLRATIEVEENIIGPPPLVAAFEPLLVKRSPVGPWIRQISSKTVHVALCQEVCLSLSTLGAPANFSTDLVLVHSYLKLEFFMEGGEGNAAAGLVNTLRVALNIQPNLRAARCVSFCPEFIPTGATSPSPTHAARLEEDQSPPPTPKKRLVF